ncbi:hypothetical protein SAMN02745134_00294 [Clostridium acidisoli DSM 12555]|uniref:Uncharacterized protein n=1 Tax=Clostridium acidisoli DSM 12555 TaxID=1121291 RepID=A0A1W1X032_9CLOT|nr:hypothetical protein SAMN02745134_00294 [Clostridium acidisoli DSM 12555]
MPPLILPRNTVIGDIIEFANYMMISQEGRRKRFTFAGSIYFERMKELNLYTTDEIEIKRKIEKLNLTNIFSEKLL